MFSDTVALRFSIGHVFKHRFKMGLDRENTWKQIAKEIRKGMYLPTCFRNKYMFEIFDSVLEAKRNGERWDPSLKSKYPGAKPKIPTSSVSAQIVADLIESGLSIRTT